MLAALRLTTSFTTPQVRQPMVLTLTLMAWTFSVNGEVVSLWAGDNNYPGTSYSLGYGRWHFLSRDNVGFDDPRTLLSAFAWHRVVRAGIRCVPEGQDVRPGLAVVVIFPLLPEGAGLALSGGRVPNFLPNHPLGPSECAKQAYLALLRSGRKVVTLQHLFHLPARISISPLGLPRQRRKSSQGNDSAKCCVCPTTRQRKSLNLRTRSLVLKTQQRSQCWSVAGRFMLLER